MELDLQICPEEIMSREMELGWASWTSFASSCPRCSSTAVQRTLSLWLCPSTAVETAIAHCTSRWAMARGHRLNTSIVLAVIHGLSGLFRAVSAVEPSLCRPLPTLSPSLIGHLASVDIKQHERKERLRNDVIYLFQTYRRQMTDPPLRTRRRTTEPERWKRQVPYKETTWSIYERLQCQCGQGSLSNLFNWLIPR